VSDQAATPAIQETAAALPALPDIGDFALCKQRVGSITRFSAIIDEINRK